MAVATGNEVQVVTVSDADGGTFTLTYSGQTTAGIAYNATASAVDSALEALSNIGAGDVTVTGPDGGPYTVTFTGALKDTNVAQLTADASSLTGSGHAVSVSTSSQGNPAAVETIYVDISAADSTVANLEVLVGQVPPAGTAPVSKHDYYA